ncbi:hypothetical protein [Klebsiella phage pKV-BS375-3.1]|nr:hypothetical protein [Klebsiella phage pKV-BS375-3.1]
MVCLGIHNMQVMHKVLHYGHPPRYTYGMPQGSIRVTRTDTPHAHLSTGYPQPALDLPTGSLSYPQHAL